MLFIPVEEFIGWNQRRTSIFLGLHQTEIAKDSKVGWNAGNVTNETAGSQLTESFEFPR